MILAIFRIGVNVTDSNVLDIGFAGVVGADRISKGESIYEGKFTPLIDRGRFLRAAQLSDLRPLRAGLPE